MHKVKTCYGAHVSQHPIVYIPLPPELPEHLCMLLPLRGQV